MNVAMSLRALRQPGAAAEATREWVQLWPQAPTQLYDCACAFALCVPIAPDEAQGQALADEAMATLRRATHPGWDRRSPTATAPALVPLHGRRAFQVLVFDRGFPTRPFAR